ncbi:oxidoreductase [Ammoniphilus oxalaticus]|uniref:Oxidoreductase n=1 Tax=Ammoniphilus oxalaticus TaxID=66863 RepID=A0A419SM58_9BACL|nr:FAD-dependent oxidoreductase [Ammoniphilus oxalaticus]RKD25149.1 oxidoreductase [Ammoniphilus oxalaticus]
MNKTIVIGAGILGASTAYHLSKLGAGQVIIVDRQDEGQATDAAAGIICPWISQRRNQAWYELAKNGAKYYPHLIAELEQVGQGETGYASVGALRLHTEREKIIQIEQRALTRKESAPEMGSLTVLNPAETSQLFPILDHGYHSLQVSGAARIDGRALREALLHAAKQNGASFIKGDAHLRWDHLTGGSGKKRIIGVKVNGHSIDASQVIVCAGAWARSIFQPLGIDLRVQFQKAQIVHLHLPNYQTKRWPVIMPPGNQYLLSFKGGRVVVGTTYEETTDHSDTRATAGGIHEILTKAIEIAPGLMSSAYLETRVGFRPYTPGFLPIIGSIPGWDGVLLANGLGASGLTVGPYLGFELAKLALGLNIDIDLKLYDIKGALG